MERTFSELNGEIKPCKFRKYNEGRAKQYTESARQAVKALVEEYGYKFDNDNPYCFEASDAHGTSIFCVLGTEPMVKDIYKVDDEEYEEAALDMINTTPICIAKLDSDGNPDYKQDFLGELPALLRAACLRRDFEMWFLSYYSPVDEDGYAVWEEKRRQAPKNCEADFKKLLQHFGLDGRVVLSSEHANHENNRQGRLEWKIRDLLTQESFDSIDELAAHTGNLYDGRNIRLFAFDVSIVTDGGERICVSPGGVPAGNIIHGLEEQVVKRVEPVDKENREKFFKQKKRYTLLPSQ